MNHWLAGLPLEFQAMLLGLVEGITEFIPVSSTGHLILAGNLMGWTDEKAKTFEIFIQLGAILAIVWLYWHRFTGLLQLRKHEGLQGRRGLMLLGLTTLPAVIAGLLVHDYIRHNLFQPLTVAISLFVGGIIIIVFESFKHTPRTLNLDDISPKQALGIGCAQMVAMWPGVSRSGATVIGGVIGGLDRKTAVEYSFLAAVPVMIAATGYDMLKSISQGTVQASDIPLFATGFVTAFISAAIAAKFFVKFVQKYDFKPFGYYRIVLAIVVLLVLV